MHLSFRRVASSNVQLPLINRATHRLNSTSSPAPDPTDPLTPPQLKTLVLSRFAKNGKFSGLLRHVVASPSVLLAACRNLAAPSPPEAAPLPPPPSLFESVSRRFSLSEMGHEIAEGRFDVAAYCVTMVPSRKKGESLVLPSLKLKVLIEALRMVLEVIYDERFATFAYGGRVGVGRHTAVRYLKTSVQNPSWWFTVKFDRQRFDCVHVSKLCKVIEEKIDDSLFIDLIRRLFECEAVSIELGGCYLGRGFPQESRLCAILINVYFNGLDKEIQDLRLRMNKENLKFESNENVLDSTSNVFYKPVKVYAVRYLDEMLFITSGSKILSLDMKNNVVKYIEEKLELKVDRIRTAIHSPTMEKIEFLGMELQAVPPSVLHPPLSEKAIRARKKYLRQKEVKALEMRNARERNRKQLGLKILSHVFKKLKRSDGFKSEIQIDYEINEIFRTWADEVVQDFLGSLEERYNWHRELSAGTFLCLQHIRDQLPQELVFAYDKFQKQVDKHLSPVKAMRALREEERREEENREQKYAEMTVHDLTRLCIRVDAPIELVRKAVKMAGFANNMGRPRPIKLLIALDDADIVKWYAGVGKKWLDYFCCCHNFKMVKTVVTYHMRFSCILTLAEKHESTKLEAIKHYSKDLKSWMHVKMKCCTFQQKRRLR
ncbi:Protein kinase domain-containing protein [Psidium guajava]|nr:Protein kinase domain-containing protein [Psidium guajava]